MYIAQRPLSKALTRLDSFDRCIMIKWSFPTSLHVVIWKLVFKFKVNTVYRTERGLWVWNNSHEIFTLKDWKKKKFFFEISYFSVCFIKSIDLQDTQDGRRNEFSYLTSWAYSWRGFRGFKPPHILCYIQANSILWLCLTILWAIIYKL